MSKLPKISHLKFELTVPSTGQVISFRPFTGREQKALLVAKESNDSRDTLKAVTDVISDCCGIDAKNLPIFDLEYVFLVLRGKSVNNKIQVQIKDDVDGQTYDAVVDLDSIQVNKPDKPPVNRVEITADVGMKLRYPTVASVLAGGKDADEWDILASSIESVWSGDEVTTSADISRPELREWLLSLPLSTIEPIKIFFESRPQVVLTVDYKRKDGTDVKKKLSGLQDFFE